LIGLIAGLTRYLADENDPVNPETNLVNPVKNLRATSCDFVEETFFIIIKEQLWQNQKHSYLNGNRKEIIADTPPRGLR
jgi:hypothetical protein